MEKQVQTFEKLDLSSCNSVYEMIFAHKADYLDKSAVIDPYNGVSLDYRNFREEVDKFATGLQSLGVNKGFIISLISENNGRWPIVDLGILKCGAIDAVRGSNAPKDELLYIVKHSDSKAVICQDVNTYEKIKNDLHQFKLNFIILMYKNKEMDLTDSPCPVFTYEEICSRSYTFKSVEMRRDDSATIMYTSGTTGNPKGVLLTHHNFIYQIEVAHDGILAYPGAATLHVLPVWHAYERIGIYYFLTRTCHLHFTNIPNLKEDLSRYHLDYMMSVPRIWEMVKNGIYTKLEKKSKVLYSLFTFAIKLSSTYKRHKMYGERRITNESNYNLKDTLKHKLIMAFYKPWHELFSHVLYNKIKVVANLNFRMIVSGGGALSMQDELFYDILGVNLRIGYGLTETAPVLTLRGIKQKNFLGSAGQPLHGTEIRILDPKTLKVLPNFEKGLVVARGPQVMKGYYKDEKATRSVFLEDGWFNTGDLGWLTNDNNLVLVGRLKETIVLSNGENVEPLPLEEACVVSPYIDQIMLVGQDKAFIGALVVPSKAALEKCNISNEVWMDKKQVVLSDVGLEALIKKEIAVLQLNKYHLRAFEKIKRFVLLKEAFSIENGLLSQTLKVKRNKVYDRYFEIIENLYR